MIFNSGAHHDRTGADLADLQPLAPPKKRRRRLLIPTVPISPCHGTGNMQELVQVGSDVRRIKLPQHETRNTNRLSKSNGPSPRRNFEPQTSSWELKAGLATSISAFQRADALRRQFGKTDGLQHPNLRTQTLCVNRGNVFFKSLAPTGNQL